MNNRASLFLVRARFLVADETFDPFLAACWPMAPEACVCVPRPRFQSVPIPSVEPFKVA